ncbi:MAG TPA: hypothetical protein VFY87_06705 [Geminicoccaceae bacterium]|nr:hypothetical protein [Geminicoccaceae bacterium]
MLDVAEAARWLALMLGVPDELAADAPLSSLAEALATRGAGRARA